MLVRHKFFLTQFFSLKEALKIKIYDLLFDNCFGKHFYFPYAEKG